MKFFLAAICCFLLSLDAAMAQATTESEYHLFTPKQGNPIEAKLVNVSRDWKEMEIINRSGSTFSVAVNVVSLDDQQFVKDWIERRPDISDFSLEVSFEKKTGAADRKDMNRFAKLETREVTYDVVIRNISKETLTSPKVEYIVLYEDSLGISRDLNGGWDFSRRDKSIKGVEGESTMSDLVFNRDQILTTDPIKLNKVSTVDGDYRGEDEVIGAIVRVSTDQGEVVGVFTGGGTSMSKYTWETAGEALGGGGGFFDRFGRGRPESVIELTKKNSIDGPTNLANREVEISATVSPTGRGEGVIVAAGGNINGVSLYVKEREIHLSQVADGELKTVSGPLPLGEFTVVGTVKKDKLVLTINGRDTVEAESSGYFPDAATSGIDVGEDLMPNQGHVVGPYEGPFAFIGGIRDCSIRLGETESKRRDSDDE